MASIRPTGISEGMQVFTEDGVRLGRIVRLYPAGFDVERGHLFPKDFHVSFGQIDRVERHAVHLLVNAAQLVETIGGEEVPRDRAFGHAPAGVDPLTDARMTHR